MSDAVVPVLFLMLAVAFISLLFFIPLPWLSRERNDSTGRGRKRSRAMKARTGATQASRKESNESPAAAIARAANLDIDQADPAADSAEPDLPPLQAVQLRYEGGDWSACPDALNKLCKFYTNEQDPRPYRVSFGLRGRQLPGAAPDFVYATGHHGFQLLGPDRQGLLEYLGAGGVVLIEDNNGMDYAWRLFLEETWPHYRLEAVKNGPLFDGPFAMSFYPKIRKHQGKPSALYRVRLDERDLDFYYSFSSDLGDGWQNHGHLSVSPDKRRQSLEMGSNFLHYALGKSKA